VDSAVDSGVDPAVDPGSVPRADRGEPARIVTSSKSENKGELLYNILEMHEP